MAGFGEDGSGLDGSESYVARLTDRKKPTDTDQLTVQQSRRPDLVRLGKEKVSNGGRKSSGMR